MNRSDLRRIDLNLLVIFEALMRERNVTRTAEQLSLGQPAVSGALARLRELYGDRLFERSHGTMVPTPRALQVSQLLGPALDSVWNAVTPLKPFEPATTSAVFKVAMSDDVEFALLPRLIQRMRFEAPDAVLVVRRASAAQMPALISSAEVSIAVGYFPQVPSFAKSTVLRSCSTVLLRGDSDDSALTLNQFCERPHALVSYEGGVVGEVDKALAKLQRERRVVLAVSQFTALGALLGGTDLLATVPDFAARALLPIRGLRAETLPIKLDAFDLRMVWRSAGDIDPAEAWMRSCLESCFADGSAAQHADDQGRADALEGKRWVG